MGTQQATGVAFGHGYSSCILLHRSKRTCTTRHAMGELASTNGLSCWLQFWNDLLISAGHDYLRHG
jgi:hypothetical protein